MHIRQCANDGRDRSLQLMRMLSCAFLVLGLCQASATVVEAQTQAQTQSQGQAQGQAQTANVLATARNERRIDDQAHPVTVIDRGGIEVSTLRSSGDILALFNAMPGLRMQTTSPVLGTSNLRIWGLPGQYTRLLLDGVHLFSDRPGGYASLRIPPLNLDRVEIIKGPAGAFYGSDSPAGAVNLISLAPGSKASDFLFNQSSRNATDVALWLSSPAKKPWSSTLLVDVHRQQETDGDDDGWSDIPEYRRGALRQRVFWDNGQGKSVFGVAGVTFEKRKGGSDFAREAVETKTVDGGLSGQMLLKSGKILSGAGALFVQSRTRDYPDERERDRLQTATIEITLRKPGTRHSWLGGIASDWYGTRSVDDLPSMYISTRPGIFFHDDWNVSSRLLVSGTARLDHHNMYGLLLSPRGSVLVRGGQVEARFSASQGYFTPRPFTEEIEAAGLARLTIANDLRKETARNVSADFTHRVGTTAVTLTVFRSQINDPAQVDRATYTLRTESEPIVTKGVELLGTLRRTPFSVTGSYTYLNTRQHGGRELALTPRHGAAVLVAAEGGRGRIGLEVSYTGTQRLDANPYRSTSEAYTVVGLVGEGRFGRIRVFVNADNLTDVRQTDWDPIARPSRDVDGRYTVDAWAPLKGRVINAGIKYSF
jgi:outer membrane receptor for ferrienterochelin and colicins